MRTVNQTIIPGLRAFSSSRLSLALRIAVSVSLLAIVVSRLNVSQTVQLLTELQWSWVLVTIVIYITAEFISGLRWQILLRAQGHEASLRALLSSLLVGRFFNQFMVSTIGGDTARFWYSSKLTGRPLHAGMVLVADRIIGLVALFVVAAGAAIAGTQLVPQLEPWRPVALAGGLGGLGALYLVTHQRFIAWGRQQNLPPLQKVVQVLEAFHNQPAMMRQAMLLSLLLQVIVVFRYLALARAVGIILAPLVFALIVPVAVLIVAVPLTINGLGLREVTFIGLLSLWGISAQQSTAFAWVDLGLGLTIALVGGLFFMLQK